MRCLACHEAGIECPAGYTVAIYRCDVCAWRAVVTAPGCAWDEPRCPKCDGSLSKEDDDGS